MLKSEVLDLMGSSKSELEWNANCDAVKKAFGGDYPEWWYEEILCSGIASRTMSRFGRTADITFVNVP